MVGVLMYDVFLYMCQDQQKTNTLKQTRTHTFVCSPSSLFLFPTSAAALIPRMPLIEYEEPAESLVTADTCVAATEVPTDRAHDNTRVFFESDNYNILKNHLREKKVETFVLGF